MNTHKHSLMALYIAVFLLALNGLFSKLIPLDAVSVTQLRSLLALVVLFLFMLLRKKTYRLESRYEYIGVYLIGCILGLHWITFYHSMQISTVAVGMLALFTYPIITVFLEPLFFNKNRIKIIDVSAGLLVLLGVYIMLQDNLSFDVSNNLLNGVLWGVLSAFLFSLRNLFQKYKFPNVSSDKLIFHQVTAISIMLILFVDIEAVTQLDFDDWLILILLGAISTAMAHSLLSFSLKSLPVKSIAMISCLQPLIAAVMAWLVLNEVPSQGVMIGGGIIVSVALYESVFRIKR